MLPNFRFIIAIVWWHSAVIVLMNPQLDLPPLSRSGNRNTGTTSREIIVTPKPAGPPADSRPKVLLNSYTENNDEEDERVHGVASDYDRDRSQRFGPPYSIDNIERARPAVGYNGNNANIDNSQGYRYSNPNGGVGLNSPGLNGGPDPLNAPGFNDNNGNFGGPPLSDGGRYGTPFNVGSPGYVNNGDDDKYYRNPNIGGNVDFDRNRGFGDFNRNQGVNGNQDFNRYGPDNENRYPSNDDRYRLQQERINQLETAKLKEYLLGIDAQSSHECSLNVQAQWNFEANVNEISQLDALAAQQRYSDFQRTVWHKLKQVDKDQILDQKLHRQVTLMANIGPSALPPDQLDRYNRLVNDMLAIYNKASICRFEQPFNCGLRLQPHLKELMATSRDWEELQYTWTEFRRKAGRDMKDLYEQMAELTNEAAYQNNFTSAAEYWTFPFESANFRQDAENVWQEILPLYELIHAYVRRKLREFYGPDRINKNAPLPDHVLGNMYGQTWSNILDLTLPYPGRHFLEVTPAMLAQGYTPLVMFQLAEEFFLSINMTVLPEDFWIDSILQQPLDRSILCQPSAWDFCNGHDYRIKMCTGVNHKDLLTVHHEMMHVQYFISYRDKPKVFRDGANAAFHEALGDAITLSVATPKHLQTLGLIQKSVDDTPHDINFLFAMALDKVVFLPFALSLDAWRWDIFNKRINKEQYNCHWWLLRERYGGIKPPVLRSEMDFDPGAKYHVPANIPYIRYFFSTVLQFQIHRALCRETQQYNPDDPSKPLHKCDIYRQPKAGNILKKIMEKGAEQPWQDVLQEVIGEGRLDGSALREYFRPLEDWLRNENLRNNEFIGWIYDGDYCKHSIDTANLQVYGGFYNRSENIKLSVLAYVLSFSFIYIRIKCV